MHTIPEKKLIMLRPDEICPSSNQARKSFDEYSLKTLSESIAASGVIQPVAVRKRRNGSYELISGEKRLRAAVQAGLRRVPCIVYRLDEETAAIYSISENLHKGGLSFFEEAAAIQRVINRYGMSVSEAAERLGIPQSALMNKLRLLRLDDCTKQRITDAELTERHARALLRISDEKRGTLLEKIISDSLTAKQTEELVYDLLNSKQSIAREEPVRKYVINDVRLFANSLTKLVDMLINSGIDARSKKYENEKYIEYRVRINKENNDSNECKQLKIC